MNRALLVLNIVLVLAVAVLFYFVFSKSAKNAAQPTVKTVAGVSTNAPIRIAYFNEDSVTNAFAMVQDVKSELTREEEKMGAEMRSWQKRYDDRLAYYQRRGETQQMSQVESENAQREMLQLQETIRNKKAELDQRYQNLYMQKQQAIKLKIEEYLKEYNKDKAYSYIFSEAGFMYYRDSAFDITRDVVKGLNADYKKPTQKK